QTCHAHPSRPLVVVEDTSDWSDQFSGLRPVLDPVLASGAYLVRLNTIAALPTEGREDSPWTLGDLAPLGRARDRRRRADRDRPRRSDDGSDVRRSEQAAEPAAEDGGEEAKDRAEGERVAERVEVEIANAGDDVGRGADARRCEEPVVGGDAEQHEDEQDEEREERRHHAVPAGA